MKQILIAIIMLLWAAPPALSYDITATIEHTDYSEAAGYRLYYGSVKGGPYPNSIQCGKPPLKADSTFDCVGTGLTIKPIYAVAVAYDASGEGPKSPEYFFAAPMAAPGIKNVVRK